MFLPLYWIMICSGSLGSICTILAERIPDDPTLEPTNSITLALLAFTFIL